MKIIYALMFLFVFGCNAIDYGSVHTTYVFNSCTEDQIKEAKNLVEHLKTEGNTLNIYKAEVDCNRDPISIKVFIR